MAKHVCGRQVRSSSPQQRKCREANKDKMQGESKSRLRAADLLTAKVTLVWPPDSKCTSVVPEQKLIWSTPNYFAITVVFDEARALSNSIACSRIRSGDEGLRQLCEVADLSTMSCLFHSNVLVAYRIAYCSLLVCRGSNIRIQSWARLAYIERYTWRSAPP